MRQGDKPPWYHHDPEGLKEIELGVASLQPGMRLDRNGNKAHFRGRFRVREGGKTLDRFEIDVEVPSTHSRDIPVVREPGGRIPREADRHMYPDGKACVVLADAFWFEYPTGLTLPDFMAGPLNSYLAAQSVVEDNGGGPWPGPEWKHNARGTLQFYGEVLGVSDPGVLVEFLRLLAGGGIKGQWPCPCPSGKRIRECHGPTLEQLEARIPKICRERSWKMLTDIIRSHRR